MVSALLISNEDCGIDGVWGISDWSFSWFEYGEQELIFGGILAPTVYIGGRKDLYDSETGRFILFNEWNRIFSMFYNLTKLNVLRRIFLGY